MSEFEKIARDAVAYLEALPLSHAASADVRQFRQRLIEEGRNAARAIAAQYNAKPWNF